MTKKELKSTDDLIHTMPVIQEVEQHQLISPYLNFIEIAINNNVDMDKIEKFMDLHERHEKNMAKKSFNMAMSKFQGMLPVIEKKGLVKYETKNGPNVNYTFATLEDIAAAIKPALAETGLSFRHAVKQGQGFLTVKCIVTHLDGHSEENEMTGPLDDSGGKSKIKAIGSTRSYLKRYTLTDAMGIIVGGEDDEDLEDVKDVKEEINATYNDEKFEEVFSSWEKLIKDGKKTSHEIINGANVRKVFFSEDQLKKINNVKVKK